MSKPDPRAGGCLLSLAILAGFVVGLARGNPAGGALVGTLAGIAIALVIWLADRARRGG